MLRSAKRRPRRPGGKRHSLAEQDRIIACFDEARARGLSPADAIAGLGTSLASVHRWRRARRPSPNMPAPTFAQELSIDHAIARLADTKNADRLSFIEALFKFVTWLRWPTQLGDHPAAITVCVVTYLSQKEGAETLDQLGLEELTLVHRHLRLDTLRRLFSDEIFAMPSFEPWRFDHQRYDRSDLLADIAWFLFAYEPPSSDPRDKASLNKAYYATQHKVFRHRWHGSHRTFRTLWLDYGASAPFHYVERFHPSLEFALDPSADDFSLSVDEIIARRHDLRIYLARCRAAVELMEERLDQRAVQAIRFPRFPESLVAEPIQPPALPAITSAIIRGFGRGDKR